MLQLPRARLEDAGQYVCTATNSAGQDQKSILLSVYGEKHYASIVLPSSVSHFTCYNIWIRIYSYYFIPAVVLQSCPR